MNKNKILAIFVLALLLASCSKSNVDTTSSGTGVSLENETQNEELFTQEEKELMDDSMVEEKILDTEIVKEEKVESISNTVNKNNSTQETTIPKTATVNDITINTGSETIIKEEVKVADPIDTAKKLTINSKCIGCGHCVRFSSKNFSFDRSTHKATVISQENIDSDGVARAIGRCPVSAISIS